MRTFAIVCLSLVAFSCTQSKQTTSKESILFVSNRDGNYEIYSISPDGDQLKNLSRDEGLDFSPSANPHGIFWYSNRSGNNDIYRFGNGQLRNLTNSSSNETLPSISPDGKKLAFVSDCIEGNRNVFVLDLESQNLDTLTQNTDYEESPSWSPDGTKLLFTRQIRLEGDSSHAANGEIFMYDMVTKQKKRITYKNGYDSGAQWSPDGKTLAFYGQSDLAWDIFLYHWEDESITNITADSLENYSPAWSPDGKKLVYTAGSGNDFQLRILDLKSGEKRWLTQSPGRNQSPVWTLDQK